MKTSYYHPSLSQSVCRLLILLGFLLTLGLLRAQPGTIPIGEYTPTLAQYGGSSIPVSNFEYSYSQQIITSNDFALGGGTTGNITAIRYKFPNTGTNPEVYKDWDVWIGHTSKTEFASSTDWEPISNLTQVFSGDIQTLVSPPANETWFEIPFSIPFNYSGGNIVVAVHEKTPGWSSADMTISSYFSNPNSGIMYRSDNNNPDPASPPTATYIVDRLPQLQFVGQQASCMPPAFITFTQTSLTGGTWSWASLTTVDIEWGKAGFSLGSGTQITGLDASSTSLTTEQDTLYHFYIRGNCGGDQSTWIGPFTFKTGYCIPPPGLSDYISSFITTDATINMNFTADFLSAGGYADSSHLIIEQIAGTNINFTRTHDFTPHALRIWVDFNNNGLFETTEEVYVGLTNTTNAPGTMDLAGSVPGTYRMRVRSQYGTTASTTVFNACEEIGLGSTVDFTLTLTPPPPCSGTPTAGTVLFLPAIISPSDTYTVQATGYTIESGLTYVWEKSTDGGTTWTQEYTGSIYQHLTNQIAPAFGSQVEYRLTVTCGTFPPAQATGSIASEYCVPTGLINSSLRYISAFSISGIGPVTSPNYTATSGVSYVDQTSTPFVVEAGIPFNWSIAASSGTNRFYIFIDIDSNGIFDDPAELIYQTAGTSFTYEVSPVTGSYTFPVNIQPGTYRMRAINAYIGTGYNGPCGTNTNGNFVDFNITVNPPPSCMPVTNLQVLNATETSADLAWDAGGTETLWDIQWGAVGFNPNTNTGVPIGTEMGWSSTSYSITGLSANTTYVIYVRADCGNGESYWQIVNFTSAYCTPTGLTISSTYYISNFHTSGPGSATSPDYTASSGVAYVDQTSTPFVITAGIPFNWSVSASSGMNIFYIWVDLNKNLLFEPSERIVSTTEYMSSPHTGSYIIPESIPAGTYRMRVANTYIVSDYEGVCGPNGYGNYVDFHITIVHCDVDPGTITGANEVCISNSITLASTATLSTGDTGVWTTSDANIAIVDPNSGEVSGIDAGSAVITYHLIKANTCEDSTSHTVTVVAPYTVSITNAPDTLYVNDTHTYTSSGTAGTWSSSDTTVATIDENTGMLTAVSPGTTNISYVEPSVCTIADIKPLVVDTIVTSTPPPPGNGNTGVDEIGVLSALTLFPNPTAENVSLKFTLTYATNIHVDLLDMNGKILTTYPINNASSGTNIFNMDVSTLANGMYSVIIRSNDSFTAKKLVITK